MTYVSTMTAAARPAFIERSDRKPLSVQVVTRPALRGCWSVNVSNSGMGLVARPRGSQDGPREGQRLELEFSLPGAGARIRVTGEVRWRHDGEPSAEEVSSAPGVSFHSFEGSGELTLARYLLEHVLNVAVAFPREPEARRGGGGGEGGGAAPLARGPPAGGGGGGGGG